MYIYIYIKEQTWTLWILNSTEQTHIHKFPLEYIIEVGCDSSPSPFYVLPKKETMCVSCCVVCLFWLAKCKTIGHSLGAPSITTTTIKKKTMKRERERASEQVARGGKKNEKEKKRVAPQCQGLNPPSRPTSLPPRGRMCGWLPHLFHIGRMKQQKLIEKRRFLIFCCCFFVFLSVFSFAHSFFSPPLFFIIVFPPPSFSSFCIILFMMMIHSRTRLWRWRH